MAKFNVSEAVAHAEKEYGLGSGEFYKVKEGANKIRLMSQTVPHQSFYKGNKNFKHVCWILDYRDNKVKLYFMAHTILKAIEALQQSEDYAFSEVPMEYDITINAKNAGTKEVDYQIMPARLSSPLTQDALDQLSSKKDIQEVVSKLREHEAKKPENQTPEIKPAIEVNGYDQNEVNVSDIPF